MRRAAVAAACLWIAGCGGGGGGDKETSPQNRSPVLGHSEFSTREDVDLSAQITGSDPDGDALTFESTSAPANGTLTAFDSDGSFTYRPQADAFGSDSFGVRVSDSAGNSITATVTIQIAPVDDPVAARNDTLRADGPSLARVNVLANDYNPDGDALKVEITEPAAVGTASVNTDGSIAISELPAGFRGITRFKYRVTEENGASAVGSAAVFVDMDPFRVVFVGDEAENDSPEVYITDLAGPPVRLTAATEGNLRMRDFNVSDNGATVVYGREDVASASTVDLSFVRTSNPAAPISIVFPGGVPLVQNSLGWGQYVVSPNGKWIAAVVGSVTPGEKAVAVLNIDDPTTIYTASPPGAVEITANLRFSTDSQHLYFLASSGGDGRSLYRTALSAPTQSTRLSAATIGAPDDDVIDYAISSDQSRIVLRADRSGVEGIYYVDPANPGTEIRLTHALNPGDEIWSDTAYQAGSTIGGSTDGTRIAYSIESAAGVMTTYVAEVGPAPNPREVGVSGPIVDSLRPDNAALLYTSLADEVFEAMIDSDQPDTLVGQGFNGRFDSTGNAVLMQQFHYTKPDMSDGYVTVAAATRGAFGISRHAGTSNMATRFTHLAAVDRAVALIAETPIGAPASTPARIALVNAWAPDSLIYLADFTSPLGFRPLRARVVSQ